jgi:hypothetical protein
LAEQQMEPSMRNLVGALLDDFRNQGTTTGNKHFGVDPQATDLEAVRREFQAKIGPAAAQDDDITVVPVNTALDRKGPLAGATPDEPPLPPAAAAKDRPLAAELLDEQQGAKRKGKKGRKPEPTPPARTPKQDLDSFLAVLDDLVRQGKMSKAEAKLAWEARVGQGGQPK